MIGDTIIIMVIQLYDNYSANKDNKLNILNSIIIFPSSKILILLCFISHLFLLQFSKFYFITVTVIEYNVLTS